MRLFAISDLHLPGGQEKPMDVFGEQWEGHAERIRLDWHAHVSEDDVVLIPGDLSWAMQFSDVLPDLRWVGEMPGRKILCKGNHDYWWGGIGQLRRALPQGMSAIQHDALDLGDAVVCGTRGWSYPTAETPLSAEDERIFSREMIRLELALQAAVKIAAGRPLVVMLHYPPLYQADRDTPFTRLIEKYPVQTVVYGHLHGHAIHAAFNGEWNGVRYQLVSCDALGFALTELCLTGSGSEINVTKT